jgi:hypothetical protein
MQKWYTRAIGIFFTLVAVSLVLDYREYGHRPETWHKLFHVVVGVSILAAGWRDERFWRPFCLVNGGFFLFVGAFGWTFPDFAGLDAFNRLDTVLHTLVGVSGLLAGIPGGKPAGSPETG